MITYMYMHTLSGERKRKSGFSAYLLDENEYTIVKRLHILLECKFLLITPILSQFYPWMLKQCTDYWMRSRSLAVLFGLRNVAMIAEKYKLALNQYN